MNTENIIPNGYQIFEDRLEVAGISFREIDALSFVKSNKKWIVLEREPFNKYDKNAIKVIGCSKGFFGVTKRFIGYVPKDVARKIAESRYFTKVIPRLSNTFISDSGYINVYFQILGPKGEKYIYNPPKSEKGGHQTEYIDRIKQLKQENRIDEAKELLINLIDDEENESKKFNQGVAPWFYEQLAIIYRKENRHYDEVLILERYFKQKMSPGAGPRELAKRLEAAQKLLQK